MVHFTQASVQARKTRVPEFFFLQKVAHHQTCNFIKNRLQHRCSTVNFAKLLKALCIIPPVSASNFNSTFLNLSRVRRISTFSQHYFFLIFLSHFMFLIEAGNISIWFYTKFSVKQARLNELITGFFFKHFKPK